MAVEADDVATTAPSTTQTAPATQPVTQPSPPPAVISLTDLAARAEAIASTLKRIDSDLANDRVVMVIEERLGALTDEISVRLDEAERLLAPAPSIDTLRTLESEWAATHRQLSDWAGDLTARAGALASDETRLKAAEGEWHKTLEDVRAAGAEEADVARRVEQIARQVAEGLSRVTNRATQVRTLQARVATQDVRVTDMLAAIRDGQTQAVGRLLEQDSNPLWAGPKGRAGPQQNLAEDSRNSLGRQWAATWAYARKYPHRLFAHVLIVAALAVGASHVRRRWGARLESDPATTRSAAVFHMPIASALVVTLPIIPWLYPQGPRLLMAMLGATMLTPAILVLRRVVIRPLVPLLYALAVFYALGLVVSVSGSMPTVSRLLSLLAMLGGVALIAHFLYTIPRSESFPHFAETRHYQVIRFVLRIGLAVMAASAIANVLGFVRLSRLLGDGILTCAYVGIMLDAYVRVGYALLAVALHVRPLSDVRVVQRHGPEVLNRLTILLAGAAVLVWLLVTLEAFAVRRPVTDWVYAVLTARWGIGAVDLSLGGILAFVASVVGAFALSRFIRFVLAEDVYPRVNLARGVPYAISTLLHYSILFVGFLVAVGALGYDMTKFTILAGAFGVGLGFGMQNIVNNFVSGLILLFERPIQVGDVIELDAATVGTVARIGIRASILRTSASAEIIVPNGLLIAGRVTNWTLTNRQRGFEIPLSVAAGPQPGDVIELLTRIARQTPGVAKIPQPEAYVTEFLANGGLKFELRAWTDKVDDWTRTRSELVTALHAAMAERGFPRV